MSTMKELSVAGKPLLVVAGSWNGAEMIVKENAAMCGHEVRVIDLDFVDVATTQAMWSATPPGSWVMVTFASIASEEVQLEIANLMHDPDKTVFVADKSVPKHLQPEKFAHYLKF